MTRPRALATALTATVLLLTSLAAPAVAGLAGAQTPTVLQQQARAVEVAVHRGLRTTYRGHVADEDSARSCLNAVNSGADACEIDVRLAADGVPLLMHDDTTGRTTRGKSCNLVVGQHSYRRLAQCRLNHGDAIPRLTDLAKAMRPYAARKSLIVELKGRAYSGTELARVNRYLGLYGYAGSRGNLTYESYIRSNVVGMKRISPRTPALLISLYTPHPDAVLAADHLDGLIVQFATLQSTLQREPGYVEEFRSRSLQLVAWKVNGTAAMRAAIASGVTGFITDTKATVTAAVRLRKVG